MSDLLGIDMPEFQLAKDRRDYLREHGELVKGKDEMGKTTYSKKAAPSYLIDDDGTFIYIGEDEVVRRERGMVAIEKTPQWILKAIMSHARGSFRNREHVVWPETKWEVGYAIRQVVSINKVDDEDMPLHLRKDLINYGAPLISRFLIRANPEYGETHFIGIRRQLVKDAPDGADGQASIVDLKKQGCHYTLDDYLFPELREFTADAVTAPEGAIDG